MLRDNYDNFDPTWIVIDAREGQNQNNFYGVGNIDNLLNKLKSDPAYSLYFRNGDQYIFQKR